MEAMETELSIGGGDRKPREVVPEASYEGAYKNLVVKLPEKGFGGKPPQKFAKFFFVITKGPQAGKVVSYRGNFFKTDEGDWIIGGKSNIAETIRAITRGKDKINDSHKGLKCVVVVKNKIGDKGPYDYVESVTAFPGDDTPVDVEALIKKHNAATAATAAHATPAAAKATAGAPAAQADLLSDIADLSDFEAA